MVGGGAEPWSSLRDATPSPLGRNHDNDTLGHPGGDMLLSRLGAPMADRERAEDTQAVSYTHLTLPTICSV